MGVLDRLATALGRNDERPNIELAEALAAKPDPAAVRELVDALSTASAPVRSDAIKVLYELGERRPELLKGHAAAFFDTLRSRNNRLVWGAMSALAAAATIEAVVVAKRLPEILEAADKGSVIAKDKATSLLVRLAAAGHGKTVLPILLDRLQDAAPNQFPTYAEEIATIVDPAGRRRLAAIIETRLPKVEGTAKIARLEKLLRKLAK
jgi:hypothetical protein